MPIEYQCPTCQARIRTPEDAAGKSARCPKCSGVSIVPGTPAAYAPRAAPEPPPPNMFADQSPPSGGGINPYAPPTAAAMQAWTVQMPKEQARARLLGPAIGMIVFAVVGLAFMALLGVVIAADPDQVFKDVGKEPAERAGAMGFFVAYFTVGLVSRVVQLLGAIAMLRMRGYGLAMAGGICAIIPCEIYCCLPCLPLGIWALIVLNNAQVKSAFG